MKIRACTSCECCNDSPSLAIQRICYILPEKKNGSHSFVVDITIFLFDLPSWLNEWFESYRIILELLQEGSKRGRTFKVIQLRWVCQDSLDSRLLENIFELPHCVKGCPTGVSCDPRNARVKHFLLSWTSAPPTKHQSPSREKGETWASPWPRKIGNVTQWIWGK